MVRYRSSRDPDVLYESDEDKCTCPGFTHRSACAHVEQQQRWKNWGYTAPEGLVLDPPPPMGSWKMEVKSD
jgi:hypothetical protein